MENAVESETELIEIVKKLPDIDPDKHDGSYELVREIVRTYRDSDTARIHGYDINDLNAVWFLCTGADDKSVDFRKKQILHANLSDEEKNTMVTLLESIWDKAQRGEYSNTPKGQSARVGMFSRGFSTFKMQGVDQERAPKEFIQMVIEISDERDEERIFSIAEKYLKNPWLGLQAATLSQFLHCLKPTVFPIINGNQGLGGSLYKSLEIKLTNYTKANSYIANSRIIRDFRDENFSFKNYRVLDLASVILDEELRGGRESIVENGSDEYNLNLEQEVYKKRYSNWHKVSETCITKDCDRAIKQAFGSTLPQFGYPFFGVEGLKEGENKFISIMYEREMYSCEITSTHPNERTKPAIRLWLRPIKPLAAYLKDVSEKELLTKKLVFLKTGPDEFTLTLEDNEMELDADKKQSNNWHNVSETCITKDCDITLKRYFVSTLPTFAYPFFEVEVFKKGDRKFISILYEGVKYSCKIFAPRTTTTKYTSPRLWVTPITPLAAYLENVSEEELLTKKLVFVKTGPEEFNLTLEDKDTTPDTGMDEDVSDRFVAEELPPYTSEDFLNDVYLSKEKYDTVKNLLHRKKNIILCGPPGVGKTFMAQRLAYSILGSKDKDHLKTIQFHQNYSYEDFIQGYRPNGTGFVIRSGPFYDFCKKAESDPSHPYFFIIDEINRGNLSKIFGELLMLIEADKRGKEVKILYSDAPFSVPENLYIIGMMNTADRSLAMIDYALRRRFSFFELHPAFDEASFMKRQKEIGDPNYDKLVSALKQVNEMIMGDPSLGDGCVIGHSYLCLKSEDVNLETLQSIVEYELIPLIKEYWFDNKTNFEAGSTVLHKAVSLE